MPLKLLERLPLPSLRTYIGLSVLTSGLALYHAHRTVTQNHVNRYFDGENRSGQDIEHMYEDYSPELTHVNVDYSSDEHWQNMLSVMSSGTWSWWARVNTYFCLQVVVWKLIEKIVFGELRFVEQLRLKDKFFEFVFSKFIIIFGVMVVRNLHELVFWAYKFSDLVFMNLLTQLSKDRLEYMTYAQDTPWSAHVTVLTLLVMNFLLCRDLFFDSFRMRNDAAYAILAAEYLIAMMKSFQVIVNYAIQIYCMKLQRLWNRRMYCLDIADRWFDRLIYFLDFIQHLIMVGALISSILMSRMLSCPRWNAVQRGSGYVGFENSSFGKQAADKNDIMETMIACWRRMQEQMRRQGQGSRLLAFQTKRDSSHLQKCVSDVVTTSV